MQHILEFQGISKYFPGVKALDNISFKAFGGEVLAFLGENGAGKSTLLKVLNGDYQPNEGTYILDGEEKHFKSPHEAIEEGISVIYQERQILLELSVAENIFLGRMPAGRFGVIDSAKANRMAEEIIKEFGLPIKPTTKVKDLNIAHQQMVEIMKACSRENLKVICFDEPTASLSDDEIEILFQVIRKLREEGKVVIYVSHRMSELQKITDKVAMELPCIWTMHALLRYEENMGFTYPEGVESFVNVLDDTPLGATGKIYGYPSDEVDFNRLPFKGFDYYAKYYCPDRISDGKCSVFYPDHNLRIRIEYDPAILSWLGVWINAGGFCNDHNVAMEMSNGYYDSVGRALENNRICLLKPDEALRFSILMEAETLG